MSYELSAVFASSPHTKRGMPIVLGGDPKGKNFLYANGNSIIIRNIEDPSIADIYTQHSKLTTVAKYSPSGYYIASADVSGKVRIWDTINKEHILKNEFQPFSGPIKDLAWSADNQRIVVVGEGRNTFGHVFNADTGTSVGEIMGQSKAINSVDFRPCRPFKIVTASEDKTTAFFEGPPFKFKQTNNEHTRFANAVRYSPNGEVFVSVGADGRAYRYDGKTGGIQGEIGDPAHEGGIYALSFSEDSTRVLTVSGDKTAKVWNVENGSLIQEFVLGKDVEDMQVGCLWQGEHIITVSLSGHINYLDMENPETPRRIIKGHNKPITCMTVAGSEIISASSDGTICHWDAQTGKNDVFRGNGHSNQVQSMAVVEDTLYSCGMDDRLIISNITNGNYGTIVKLSSVPNDVAVTTGGLGIVACAISVVLLQDGHIVTEEKVSWGPTSAALHPKQTEHAHAAVGGLDNKVHIYSIAGNNFLEWKVLDQSGPITSIEFSHDGAYMASCDSNKRICLYALPDYEPKMTVQWSFHTAKINSLSWTPDSKHLASGSLDTNVMIWNPDHRQPNITIKNAHPQNQVTGVQWLNNNTLVSVGQDSSIRRWNINHN